MKNRTLKLILAFIALIYVAPKAMAQEEVPKFVDPLNPTRFYNPTDGLKKVVFFEGALEGTITSQKNEVFILNRVIVVLNPSQFSQNISDVKISMYYPLMDSTCYYHGDVNFIDGISFTKTDFPAFATPQPFKIEGYINTDGLNDNDTLIIETQLEMVRNDGKISATLKPQLQYLIYKAKPSTGGIHDYLQAKFSVYPNPFVNELTINLPKGEKENVTITNTLGETIYSGPSGLIETSLFPTGLYFIHTPYGICKVIK